MTRILDKCESTAAMKIAKKALLKEISDYPQRIGQYKLVSTDGIKAVYENKKGRLEEVRMTDDLLHAAHRYLVADGLLSNIGYIWHANDEFLPVKRERLEADAAIRRGYEEAVWESRMRREED